MWGIMGEPASVEEVAEAMYSVVARAKGLKRITPGELIKSAELNFGERVDKRKCKEAIRCLIDSGRCVYTYFGSTGIDIAN